MSPAGNVALAVDLGGTKVAAAVVSSQGEILVRVQEPTNQEGPIPLIAQITRLLQSLVAQRSLAAGEIQGVGIGIPAVLEPETDFVIWGPNLHGWRNIDLRGAVQHVLGVPVYVEYDGHTAVLGEYWQGAGRGYDSIAMLIVGTGIGGGLVMDGRLVRGHDRLAGAAGWFALTTQADASDPRGQSLGHWESLAAGPGIARRAVELLPDYPYSSLKALPAEQITARIIFEAARQGDALAQRVVHETAQLLGLGVANVVSLVNPQIVVLGGSIGCQPELLSPVKEVVIRWAQPASGSSVRIVNSQLGPDAGLFGAAYAVWIRTESDQASATHDGNSKTERR